MLNNKHFLYLTQRSTEMSLKKSAIAVAAVLSVGSTAAVAGTLEVFSYGFATIDGAPVSAAPFSGFGDNIEAVTVSELWTDARFANADTPVDLDGLNEDGDVEGAAHDGTGANVTGTLNATQVYEWPGRRQVQGIPGPGTVGDRILSGAASTTGPDGTVRGNRMVAYTTTASLNHETDLTFVVKQGGIYVPDQLFFAVYAADTDTTDAGVTPGWVLAGSNNDIINTKSNGSVDQFLMQIDTGEFPQESNPGYTLMKTDGTFTDEISANEALTGNVVLALLDRAPNLDGTITNYSPIFVADKGLVAGNAVTIEVTRAVSAAGTSLFTPVSGAEQVLLIVPAAATALVKAKSTIDVQNVYLTSHAGGYSPGGDDLGGANEAYNLGSPSGFTVDNGDVTTTPQTAIATTGGFFLGGNIAGQGGFEFVDPTQREPGDRTVGNDFTLGTANVQEYTRDLVRRGFVINPSMVTGLGNVKATGSPDRVSSQATVNLPNEPEFSLEITDSAATTDRISLIRVSRPAGESVAGVTRVNYGGVMVTDTIAGTDTSAGPGPFPFTRDVNSGSIPELPAANGSTRLDRSGDAWQAVNLDIGVSDSTNGEPVLDGAVNILEITVNDQNNNQLIDALDNAPLHAGDWRVRLEANFDQDRNEPANLGNVVLIDDTQDDSVSHTWTINAARVKVPYIVINAGSLGFSSFIKVTNEGNTPARIFADAVVFNRDTNTSSAILTNTPIATVAANSLASINEADLNAIFNLTDSTIYQLGITFFIQGSPDEVQVTAFQKDTVGRTSLPVYYDTDLRAFQQ